MGNVSASLSLGGTFSDIFYHNKLSYQAESTPCLKFPTSDDLLVESSKTAASCLYNTQDHLTTFCRISNFFTQVSRFSFIEVGSWCACKFLSFHQGRNPESKVYI